MTDEENTDAVHVNHRAVHGGLQGELVVQEVAEQVDRLRRFVRRAQQGDARLGGDLDEFRFDDGVVRDDDTRNVERANRAERFNALVEGEGAEVVELGVPDDLHPLVREDIRVPGQGELRAMEIRVGDLLVKPRLAIQRDKVEALARLLHEKPDGDRLLAEGLQRLEDRGHR